jgi:hypothetical protein
MPVTFFLDRSLGKEIVAQALRAAGADVEIHDDHFPPDAKDEDWLTEVGSLGWIVLTKDRRFHPDTRNNRNCPCARPRLQTHSRLSAGTGNGCNLRQVHPEDTALRDWERRSVYRNCRSECQG